MPPSSFPSYNLTINYSCTEEELRKSISQYDWHTFHITNDDMLDIYFPLSKKGKAKITIHLVDFGERIMAKDVNKQLDICGYHSATSRELLALGAQYPNLQRNSFIVSILNDSYPFSISVMGLLGSSIERRLTCFNNSGYLHNMLFAATSK